MKQGLSLLITIFLFGLIQAQPTITWQKSIGGSNHEYTCNTIPTNDGGLAFVGFSESDNGDVSGNHGGIDLMVGKLSSDGTLQWSFLYGGTEDEKGYDIIQTSDNNYFVAGWTDSNDGDVTGNHDTYGSDFWVLKLNSNGTLIWAKCFGGTNDDDGTAIVQTNDGNIFIAGSTYSDDGDISGNYSSDSDFWIIKINDSGTLLSQKCIGGTNYDEGINLAATSDNGCVVCGRTSSDDGDAVGYHGGNDMLIAKLNSSLTTEWSKCYGGTETEECNSIIQLTDGSYAALGYTSTHNNGDVTGHHGSQGSDDFWLLKLNSAGVTSWAKCFGGSGDDQADGLAKTSDGGFIMCGLTNSTDGDVSGFHTSFFEPDTWVAKVNSSGVFQWQRCCGGTGQDEGFNIFELSTEIYVITAFSYSNDYDVSGNHGSADGWIFKLNGNTSFTNNIQSEENLIIYPNPASETINIKGLNDATLEIFNAQGIFVKSQQINFTSVEINLRGLAIGNYILKITKDNKSFFKKIIVQ